MESHGIEKEALVLRCGGVGKTWCRGPESIPDCDNDKHEIHLSLSYEPPPSLFLNDNNNLIKIDTSIYYTTT